MTRPTSLRSLRDSMRASFRRAIERGAAARSPTTALLRTALEWGGPVPGIGPDCRRWAGLIRARGGDPARAIDPYRAAVASGLDTASLHHDLGQALPIDERSLGDVGPGPASFLARSAALPFLRRWLSHVSPSQLLVLRSEQLARDLPGTMARICRFIGVPVHVPTDTRRHNEGRYPALSPAVETTLRAWFEPHERALEDFLARLPHATP